MPQNKIHDTPVARVLMATSSSTTFGGPPSPLEKAIRNSSTNQNLKVLGEKNDVLGRFFYLLGKSTLQSGLLVIECNHGE
jgi:hypothetical protein